MNNSLEKYFGKSLSIEEQTYNLAMFYLIIGYSIALCVDIFLSRSTAFIISHVSVLSLGLVLFMLHDYLVKTVMIIKITVLSVAMVAFPVIYLVQPTLISENPIYFIVGIAFTCMVFQGRHLILCIIGELIIYGSSIAYVVFFYCSDVSFDKIVITEEKGIVISIAIFTTGIMGGILFYLRNRSLTAEMELNNEANKNELSNDFAKDMFLVNVSHEIRTPLQAIMGTAEIIVDMNKNDRIAHSIQDIANSSRAILAITNDLMDFSRMKEDEIVLEEKDYKIINVLDDIMNMVTIRLNETNIHFFTTINPNIPNLLHGDQDKIRQVLVNILNNAIKYTINGSIELTVDYEQLDNETIHLKFTVADTGIGMNAETAAKLFELEEESNKDQKKENVKEHETSQSSGKSTYGKSLRLCKKILMAMGGDIKMTSVLGRGSTFVFTMEQKVISRDKLASVHSDNKHILVFEKTFDDKRAFENIMVYWGIRCDYPQTKDRFMNFIENTEYSQIFIAQENLEVFSEKEIALIYAKNAVVLVDCNKAKYSSEAACVCSRPINCINVGAIMNDEFDYSVRSIINTGDFVCPQARILVVDDNLINVEVATGLLKRYQCQIMSANSGRQCLNMLERNDFDLIFLDYMMPEMDGIDTLKKIREFEQPEKKNVPVVALTANAVSGAKEMFMNAGFNEYVSKPIEIEHFEYVIKKLLPKNLIKLKKKDNIG